MSESTVGLLLDTHAWIWMIEWDRRLSTKAVKELERASEHGNLLVSAISVWEIAVLVSKNRLQLSRDIYEWTTDALAAPGVRFVNLEPAMAIDSALMAGSPNDPADRILIATARRMNARLMTSDRRILDYARRTRGLKILKATR
jgi:PIN domain nuclease of toxin-antitoxin system